MALLDDVKTATMLQGVTDPDIVGELTALIEAGKAELRTAGVDAPANADPLDPLAKQAVIFFVKANFGFDNPDARLYDSRFERMKQILGMDDVTKAGAEVVEP